MTVNVQLQVSGDNISTYNIYQDSDNFSTAVLSDVAASTLLSGVQLDLNNYSTTVRLRPVGSCNNYNDIIINFGDTTPSVTELSNEIFNTSSGSTSTDQATQNNFVSNGAGIIFGTYYDPDVLNSYYRVSYDNGDTWDSSILLAESVMCFTVWDGYSFKIVDQLGNGYQFVEQTPGSWLLESYEISNVQFDAQGFYYQNGNYYILTHTGTDTHLYRSTDGINYINVLTSGSQSTKITTDFMKGYGNTLYLVGNTKSMFWKSVDNGLTWNSIQINYPTTGVDEFYVSGFYVEDENRILAYMAGPYSNTPGVWIYSIDGGGEFYYCWLPATSYKQSAGIIKVGSVYFVTGETLYYTSSSLFTSSAGTTQIITNTDNRGTEFRSASNGQFNSYSLCYSKGRIIYTYCYDPASTSFKVETKAYVGLITNT
jgi:hypothetical protein